MAYMRAGQAPSKLTATSPPLTSIQSDPARDGLWRASPAMGQPTARGARPAQASLLDVAIANRPMLVSIARGVLGCPSRAEDVVHDVFVNLIDLPQQNDVRQPMGYIARMVRNASIDAGRRQSLENVYRADEEDGFDVPSPELTPEARVQACDTLRRICDALAQLPERSRAAFEMVRVREETLQSAARELNVSQTLVHFMVRDAQRHCAACLDACDRNDAPPAFVGSRSTRA